ncbi:hypothetical protein JHK85_001129 [Glycine max]|nr:hypothetical protein JHK85_001129 [Glycine max]
MSRRNHIFVIIKKGENVNYNQNKPKISKKNWGKMSAFFCIEQEAMIVEVEDLLCLTNINFRSKGGGANNRLHKVDMAGLAQF